MTGRQLHRLKKQWLAEGYCSAVKDFSKGQINESWAALARAAWPVIRWICVNILPDLIREYGPQLIEKIKNSEDKEATSKSAFKKMLYASLDKVPADKLANLAADKLAASGSKSINKELSKAEGYVAPSTAEVTKMVEQYKAEKGV